MADAEQVLQEEPTSGEPVPPTEESATRTSDQNGSVENEQKQAEGDTSGQQNQNENETQQEVTATNENNNEQQQDEETPANTEPTPETNPPEPEPPAKKVLVSISGTQLRQLVIGTDLQKVKKGKLLQRLFSISKDLVRLTWNSKRKPQSKAQIPLSQVQDVLKGRQTSSFQSLTCDESLCFSIVYAEGGHSKTLDLIASSPEQAQLWINGILSLTGTGVSESTSEVRKRWLRKLFDEADVNGDGTLDLKEIIQMMRKLNVGISNKVIKRKFKEADADGNSDNKLDFDEFIDLFESLSDQPEMRKLFNLYSSVDDGTYMTAKDLLSFLHEVQDIVDATEEYCQSIIERYEPSEEGKNNYQLSLDGFTQFMLSPDNNLFCRSHRQVYQDMSQPLSHYFIASSHNTYLEEDQLSGPSSINAYIRALKQGCRCVELDCWDGDDNEPIIYHGHTLTSKILFKDVIEAIKEHAFVASQYPLILSIENHCSVKQQHVMAEHMKEIFGELLYNTPRNPERGALPSPEELRNKILVKAKKLPNELEEKSDDEGEVSDEDEGAEVDPEEIRKVRANSPKPENAADTSADQATPTEIEEPRAEPQPEVRKIVDSGASGTKRRSLRKKKGQVPTAAKPTAKRKLSSKLSKCVNYVQSVHFKGFDEIKSTPFYHMSSFGESTAFKYSEELAAFYVEYNKNHLSRTYPSGRRIDSSNYEPVLLWNSGCQIVALNYQTPGKPMDWNIGKFQQNGGCGYILKPEVMREDFAYFDHSLEAGGINPKVVTIRVISGQQLPKPEGGSETGEIIDPYVRIEFTGVNADRGEYKTKVVKDNGFNPVWNETINHVVHFPELAIVRFKVMDYDLISQDDFIGQFTLPLESMETGYHLVQLYNREWEPIDNATLFVEVSVVDYIGPPQKSKERLRHFPLKKSRQYPSMKPTCLPQLDSQLKTVGGSLRTGVDAREDFIFTTLLFKDACGKPMQAQVIECVSEMFKMAHDSGCTLKLVSQNVNNLVVYQTELDSKANASLVRMVSLFDRLNSQAVSLTNLSQLVISELENILAEALRLKPELDTAIGAMIPKKAEQAKFGYSFDVRTLKNEINQMKAFVSKANGILSKVPTVAETFGIEVSQPQEPTVPEEPTNEVAAPTGDETKAEETPTEGNGTVEAKATEDVPPTGEDTTTVTEEKPTEENPTEATTESTTEENPTEATTESTTEENPTEATTESTTEPQTTSDDN